MNDLVSFVAARRNSNRKNEDFLTLKKKFMSADGDTSNSIDAQNVFGVYNFAEWLENVDTNSKNPVGDTANLFGTEFDRENTVLMSNFNEEPEAHKVRSSKFFKRLMYVISRSRLDKFIPSVERNYNGVINGEEAYSETIAYKISKK